MSDYARRGKRLADFIGYSDKAPTIVVQLKDGRRVRWPRDGKNTLIAFGSLNPANANYAPGGQVIGTV